MLHQTYYAMKRSGHTKAAQKELAKIKDLINRKLLPELDELENELNIKGYHEIVSRHVSLIGIIEKRDEIRREAEEWKMIK